MRHGKTINHLGRTAPHRKAMLSNMAVSLIMHKRITTTVAKARELRKYVEPLITRSKEDTTHSRRICFSYLQDKESIKELFSTVADKVGQRPGGYTRIIKLGIRPGDSADMALIELVDFNELLTRDQAPTRRSRRRRGGAAMGTATASAANASAQATYAETATATADSDAPAEDLATTAGIVDNETATGEATGSTPEVSAAESDNVSTDVATETGITPQGEETDGAPTEPENRPEGPTA